MWSFSVESSVYKQNLPPAGSGLFHSLVGAVPRVLAPISEITDFSSVEGVGTGALPLQKSSFFG
jgi:hypothetical protein